MNSVLLRNTSKIRNFSSAKRTFTGTKIIFNKAASVSSSTPEVKGLSKNCVDVPNEPVGPGAAKDSNYKNPEYFCYNNTSYFEAEIEMANYRCPQPSKYKPYYQKEPK